MFEKIKLWFNDLFNKFMYYELMLNPPKWWLNLMFVVHWITLPIKVILIGFWTFVMFIYELHKPLRKVPEAKSEEVKKNYFEIVWNNLPILKHTDIELYVCRVPFNEEPNGMNHNDDHQSARHGIYTFLMRKIDKLNDNIKNALERHIGSIELARGYKINQDGQFVFNLDETAGDQLLGICMGLLGEEDNYKFENLLKKIIESNYGLITFKDGVFKKSSRATWSPGLLPVGAQALTILAALKLGSSFGMRVATKHYNKLLWKYGYGILSLFPTTYIPSKRGLFNDINCLHALYILNKLSTSKLGKLYWGLIGLIVWLSSWKMYNSYATGLVNEMLPGVISKKYLDKCDRFTYEFEPLVYTKDFGEDVKPSRYPVELNLKNQGEFLPEEEENYVQGGIEHKTGLGMLAYMIMLDPELIKKFLTNK